jgi:hypothetical protein
MPRILGAGFLPTLALILSLALPGCAPDQLPTDTSTPSSHEVELPTDLAERLQAIDRLEDLHGLANDPAGVVGALRRGATNAIEVPAGSVDAIADAVAAAGPGGCVVLAAGDHFVSERVLIEQRTCIVGEPGAVVRTSIAASAVIDAVFHFRGAARSSIWGLQVRTDGQIGNTAVMIENSPHTVVAMNQLRGFVQSVGIESSDHVKIWSNEIEASAAWFDGVSPISFGVNVYTGRFTRVVDNTFSQAFFGLWACDAKGQAIGNRFVGNYIGLILCKIPEGEYLLDGREIFATVPATRWMVVGNEATGNFDVGYLAIDGSTENFLFENEASGNGAYDIELAGDSFRFGFLTPRASKTKVVAGSHSDLKVKDCGDDNRVVGFDSLVDNATDPCY